MKFIFMSFLFFSLTIMGCASGSEPVDDGSEELPSESATCSEKYKVKSGKRRIQRVRRNPQALCS